MVGFNPLLGTSFKRSRLGSRAAASLHSLLAGAKELEEEGEDVDDVQVDVEGSEDVFLGAERVPAVPHQHLGVECQELGEERGKGSAVIRRFGIGRREHRGLPPVASVHPGQNAATFYGL